MLHCENGHANPVDAPGPMFDARDSPEESATNDHAVLWTLPVPPKQKVLSMSKAVFCAALTALLGSACTPSAPGGSDDRQTPPDAPVFDDPMEWVAISTDTLEMLEEAGGNGLNLEAAEVIGDVAIVPATSSAMVELSEFIHQVSGRCGGFTAHDTFASAHSAAALAAAPIDPQIALVNLTIDNDAVAQAMIAETSEIDIRGTIETLSAFHNRLHSSTTGAQAPVWIHDFWQSLAAERSDVSIKLVEHSSTPQQSVMMTIEGTTKPDEVVIIGGHLDSIAGSGDSRAPGADDDASGIATISEIARVIVATDFRPERTLHIIGYAAEEVGLRGSAEIAQSFANDGTDVVAVMQFDMTNFNGSNTDIVFIRDRTDDALTNFVGTLVDTYLAEISHGNGNCGYGCSDHASWNSRGFPTVFPFEASLGQHNQNIHTAGDTLSVSDNEASHALKFAKLGTAFVAEVAKGNFDGSPPPPPPDQNSCEESNACGTQAPGGCWCDDACMRFNDCCSDGPC